MWQEFNIHNYGSTFTNYCITTITFGGCLNQPEKLCCTLFACTGNDFQLDQSIVCVSATVNNASDCGSCFRINITEDSDSEPTEQFNISFTVISVQPEGVNINNFSEAIVYIRDDDGKSQYWASL